MTELIQIIICFITFSLTLLLPLNIFDSSNKINNSFKLCAYNLIINCSILLIASLLPITISNVTITIFFIYVTIFFKNYIKFIKENIITFKFNLNATLFFLVFFILSVNMINGINLGWDAKLFYFQKTISYFQNNTFEDLKNLGAYYYHPHFGSYLWSFFWKISFVNIEHFGRLFYLYLYCFSLLMISNYISEKTKINKIIFLFLIILSYKYSIFSGLQEVLIFSLLILCSIFIFEIENYNNKNKFDLIFILLTSNLIFWIKTEAILYVIFLAILLNLSKLNLNLKIFLNIFIIVIIALRVLIYKHYQFQLNGQSINYNLEYIKTLSPEIIFSKIIIITKFLIYYTLTNYLLIVSLLATLLCQKKQVNFVKIFLFLNIIYIYAIYILRANDLESNIRTTMDRVIFSTTGFYIIGLIIFLKKRFLTSKQNL